MLNKTQELVYPYPGIPAPGTATELGNGIFWMSLPLPFAMGQINVWLLEDGDGWTLVDTGPAIPECQSIWNTLLNAHLRGRPIQRIFVTHHHPDHVGLARWLSDRFSCDVYLSKETADKVTFLLQDDISYYEAAVSQFYRAHGICEPAAFVEFETGRKYRRIVSGSPERMRYLEDGDTLEVGGRAWRVLLCNGHARGHAALYCDTAGVLISGDQILPKITSNISLFSMESETNPLAEYFASLQRLRTLPGTTLVLPSHGRVFSGLHLRIDQIEQDHHARLTQVESFCDRPRDAAEISSLLFPRQLNELNRLLALGETLAHLRFLESERRVQGSTSNERIVYSRLPG